MKSRRGLSTGASTLSPPAQETDISAYDISPQVFGLADSGCGDAGTAAEVFPGQDTRSAVWHSSFAACKDFGSTWDRVKMPSKQSRTSDPDPDFKEGWMLRWALVFFLVALVSAVMGFTGIAVAAAGIARILFFFFVVLFLITLLSHVARRP